MIFGPTWFCHWKAAYNLTLVNKAVIQIEHTNFKKKI